MFQRGHNLFKVRPLVIGKVRIQIHVFLTLELELFLMLHCLKAPSRLKHPPPRHPPTPHSLPPTTNSEDSGLFSGLWRYSVSKSSWYWKHKWRMCSGFISGMGSWIPLAAGPACGSQAVGRDLQKGLWAHKLCGFGGIAPLLICRNQSHIRFLEVDCGGCS